MPDARTQELLLALVTNGTHDGGEALQRLFRVAQPVAVVAVADIVAGSQLRQAAGAVQIAALGGFWVHAPLTIGCGAIQGNNHVGGGLGKQRSDNAIHTAIQLLLGNEGDRRKLAVEGLAVAIRRQFVENGIADGSQRIDILIEAGGLALLDPLLNTPDTSENVGIPKRQHRAVEQWPAVEQ